MIRPAARWTLLGLLVLAARPGAGQDAAPPPPPVPRPAPPPVPEEGQAPIRPRHDQAEEDRGEGEVATANAAARFAPPPLPPLDQAEVGGLPAGSRPEVLTWERAYQLAWVRAHADPPPRFEALDPVGLGDQFRRLGGDDFARFRTEFVAARTFRDPAVDFLKLQALLRRIGAARDHLVYDERWSETFKELIEGEASGLSQVDLDRSSAATTAARREFLRLMAEYRDRLDEFKVVLGLPPRAAVILDPAPLAAFEAMDRAVDRWTVSPQRDLGELSKIVGRLPELGDLVIRGRPVLAEGEENPGHPAAILDLGTRFALGNRHDRDEPADAIELRVRRRLRRLAGLRSEYTLEARGMVLDVRLLDGALERIIAPPAGAAPGSAGLAAASLVDHARQLADHRGRLVAAWAEYQAERLAAERDLGLVIAADWPSFLARFTAPPRPIEPDAGRPAGDAPAPEPDAPPVAPPLVAPPIPPLPPPPPAAPVPPPAPG